MERSRKQGAYSFQRGYQGGLELIVSVTRPQLAPSTHSPAPNAAILIQRERASTRRTKIMRGTLVTDSLDCHSIPIRAPDLAIGVVSSRENASLCESMRITPPLRAARHQRGPSERSSTWVRVGWRTVRVWPRPSCPAELSPNTQRPSSASATRKPEPQANLMRGDSSCSLRTRTRPRRIGHTLPHPKAAFGIDGSALILASYRSDARQICYFLEGGRRTRGGLVVTSSPQTALRIKNEGVLPSPVHLNRLQTIPRYLRR